MDWNVSKEISMDTAGINQKIDTCKLTTLYVSIRFLVNNEMKREILCFEVNAKYKVVVVMWNKGTEVT